MTPEMESFIAAFIKKFPTHSKGSTKRISRIRFGREFIIIITGLKINIIPLKNAVWVYSIRKKVKKHSNKKIIFLDSKNGAYYIHKYNRLYIHFADGKREKYPLTSVEDIDTIDFIIGCVSLNCPEIAVGYSKEAKALWKNKDIGGLRAYARRHYKGV
jgi:hypothetical protein